MPKTMLKPEPSFDSNMISVPSITKHLVLNIFDKNLDDAFLQALLSHVIDKRSFGGYA